MVKVTNLIIVDESALEVNLESAPTEYKRENGWVRVLLGLACAKGLSNRLCLSVSQSVSQSVCPVKNVEISTYTGLNNCCMRQ